MCEQCGLRYDDATRWTVCPHNSLNVAHDTPYCRRHDLYNCGVCRGAELVAPYAVFGPPTIAAAVPDLEDVPKSPGTGIQSRGIQ